MGMMPGIMGQVIPEKEVDDSSKTNNFIQLNVIKMFTMPYLTKQLRFLKNVLAYAA